MASRTVTPEQLAASLQKILEEYGDDVERASEECVREVAKTGRNALRSNSPKKKGKYASKWAFQVEKHRLYTVATIYNAQPGLPHLLEFGHVSRNGTGRTYGFVGARPHIASVEQSVIQEYTQKLTRELSDL